MATCLYPKGDCLMEITTVNHYIVGHIQLHHDVACENSHLSSARHDVIGYKDSKSNHYGGWQTLQNSGRKIILRTTKCLELIKM